MNLKTALDYALANNTTIAATARAIGVPATTIYSWLSAARALGETIEWPSRGPSAPVYPAPSNAPERHHTAAGIAWRLDIRPTIVEIARRLREYPTHMTDAEALDLARDLGVSSQTVGV